MMLFYDFEVFRHDWLVCIIDVYRRETVTICNDPDELHRFYESHSDYLWCGYNSKHYDQYILKGILCGFDPYAISRWIIIEEKQGWEFSSALSQIKINGYDVMSTQVSLKTLEGFMGADIQETNVPFDIDRPLTEAEIQSAIKYCLHDVEQTTEVFQRRLSDYTAMIHIVQEFKLPLARVDDTSARITAKVLDCTKCDRTDEMDYFFFPCISLQKYADVMAWFDNIRKAPSAPESVYKQSRKVIVAGIPHTFGFGGLHGAADHPVHYKGNIYHVDVNNYYPSMLIAHGIVTRSAANDNYTQIYNTRKALKMKQLEAQESGQKGLAKEYKRKQLPYKKMLNALSGAMKDKTNPAYDPRNNNIMCINGQLMLLDLIEHLETIPGFILIQSNTDGLIIQLPEKDAAYEQMISVCRDWENRCSTDKCRIELATDRIDEIWQKDVNNYLWTEADGSVEAIGAYVKSLNDLDYDLPVVNNAVREYMLHGTPVEATVHSTMNLRDFQKIVKLSSAYDHVEHEYGFVGYLPHRGISSKPKCMYGNRVRYDNKCFRVFASSDIQDGQLLKIRGSEVAKYANTPDHCFIDNTDVRGKTVPAKLDRQYYIDLAWKRLYDFGIEGK